MDNPFSFAAVLVHEETNRWPLPEYKTHVMTYQYPATGERFWLVQVINPLEEVIIEEEFHKITHLKRWSRELWAERYDLE